MYKEDNDALVCIIKDNPVVEDAIKNIISDNKKVTSMFIHELRNPLSLIKGTLQYIELKHPETKEFKYWDQLHDLTNDLENMMSDFSQFNTCNSIKKADVDLLTLITVIKDNFMPQASNQQIELSMTVDEGCGELFSSYSCDAAKIKQVLSNLIKNAFEATVPGNFIHIGLGCLPAEEDTLSKLSITISNNGLPIPESEIGSIFDPFVTYKKGGTGVGLALARRVVDLHFGSISVTSNGNLTSFEILLPIFNT